MAVSNPLKEDLVQEQILQAAKRLFQVHGLYKVTMDDVAKAIGKGRSSLYYYYKSKDEIFDAVVAIEIKEMIGAMARAVGEAITVEQKIKAFCIAKFKIAGQMRPFFQTLDVGMDADAMSQFNKTKIAHHSLIMKQEGDLLKQVLNEGIENGELNTMDNEEKEVLIFVMLSSLHGLKRELLIEDNLYGIEPAVERLSRMMMYGITK